MRFKNAIAAALAATAHCAPIPALPFTPRHGFCESDPRNDCAAARRRAAAKRRNVAKRGRA